MCHNVAGKQVLSEEKIANLLPLPTTYYLLLPTYYHYLGSCSQLRPLQTAVRRWCGGVQWVGSPCKLLLAIDDASLDAVFHAHIAFRIAFVWSPPAAPCETLLGALFSIASQSSNPGCPTVLRPATEFMVLANEGFRSPGCSTSAPKSWRDLLGAGLTTNGTRTATRTERPRDEQSNPPDR